MCLYPNVCNVCFSRQVKLSCRDCNITGYCSNRHLISDKERHTDPCHQISIALILDQYLTYYKLPEVVFNKFAVVNPNVLPSNTNNMMQHFKLKSTVIQWISKCHLHEEMINEARYYLKHYPVGLGLSLLYAIKETQIGYGTFVIHIVGASKLEKDTNWEAVTDMVKHWTKITHITYHLIGPEVVTYDIYPEDKPYHKVVCHHRYYHEVFNKIQRANMIALFNGLISIHEEPILEDKSCWDPTLPILFKHAYVPLVITSYTLVGINGDIMLINSMGLKLRYIRHAKKNPYAFLTPNRNWCFDGNPIYYENEYIAMLERID